MVCATSVVVAFGNLILALFICCGVAIFGVGPFIVFILMIDEAEQHALRPVVQDRPLQAVPSEWQKAAS